MSTVYILYSSSLDSFYIGSCLCLEQRLQQHKEKKFKNAFTTSANDWVLFLAVSVLHYGQARKIEMHIKKMKSKTYINNLSLYPELVLKLIKRFESTL
jgi:putative endonuclease